MYIFRNDLMSHYYNKSYNRYSDKVYELKYPGDIRKDLRHSLKTFTFNLNFINTETEFESYISKYFIYPGQTVKNIKVLYYKLMQEPVYMKWELIQLIDISTQKRIKQEHRKLNLIEIRLLELINETVYIENGHPSELWFAIITNGKVCGALNSTNIETDVIKDKCTFSLKCYKKLYNLDLGSLDDEFVTFFKKFTVLSEIITGHRIDKSYGRVALNGVIKKLNNPKINEELKILNDYKSKNIIIQNFMLYINEITGDNIIKSFSTMLNQSLTSKMNTVDWWIIIVGNELITINSRTMIKKLQMVNNMKMSIKNFKGFKLFVNGNYLYQRRKS